MVQITLEAKPFLLVKEKEMKVSSWQEKPVFSNVQVNFLSLKNHSKKSTLIFTMTKNLTAGGKNITSLEWQQKFITTLKQNSPVSAVVTVHDSNTSQAL